MPLPNDLLGLQVYLWHLTMPLFKMLNSREGIFRFGTLREPDQPLSLCAGVLHLVLKYRFAHSKPTNTALQGISSAEQCYSYGTEAEMARMKRADLL